ncbi:MAG: response regulator [Eubacteriales bacterium]|nr:response regulator [Eubacteriales bacterium]
MTLHVLLVDDEPHVVDSIRAMLENDSPVEVEVHCAFFAQQAIQILTQVPISLMITDIRMPEMSGLELMKEARSINPDCKVILLTAYSDFSYAYEGLRLHAVEYILKTEESSVIRKRIVKVLQDLQGELRSTQWVKERSSFSPLHEGMIDQLLSTDATPHQEELAALLHFEEKDARLLLIVFESPPNVALNPPLIERALKMYLGTRIDQMLCGHMKNGCYAFVLQMSNEMLSLTSTWLIGALERTQAAYAAATQAECSILTSPLLRNGSMLPTAYRQVLEGVAEEGFENCVHMISLEEESITHVTVRFIKSYIKTHITEDLSLLQLSSITGYNASYLSRVFREQTGEPMNRYIAHKRMQYITTLMKNAALSQKEIMRSSGFVSETYYYRFVKQETGLSPKQYRMHLAD